MKSLTVSKEYRDNFMKAFVTFKHQLVFCPLQRKQVRLNSPSADVSEDQLHYAGEEIDPDKALQLAYGNCDPFTFKKLHDFDPDRKQVRYMFRYLFFIILHCIYFFDNFPKEYE